jgi:hypothetical protein
MPTAVGVRPAHLDRRVARGNFTPGPSQNRTLQSPVIRLLSLWSPDRGSVRDPRLVGEGTRSFPDGIVPDHPGFPTTPQPFVLPADPPQQVGVDAFQEGIQGRSVERPAMIHPTSNDRVYLIGEVLFGQAVRWCSRHDRTSALILFRACLLIAGRNDKNIAPSFDPMPLNVS